MGLESRPAVAPQTWPVACPMPTARVVPVLPTGSPPPARLSVSRPDLLARAVSPSRRGRSSRACSFARPWPEAPRCQLATSDRRAPPMAPEELEKGGGADAALEVQVLAGGGPGDESDGGEGEQSGSPGSQANSDHKRSGPRRSIMGLALAPFKRASNRFRMSAARCGPPLPLDACRRSCIPRTIPPTHPLAFPLQRQHVPAQRGRAGGPDVPGEHDWAGRGAGQARAGQGSAGVRRRRQPQRRPPAHPAAALAAGAAAPEAGCGTAGKAGCVSRAPAEQPSSPLACPASRPDLPLPAAGVRRAGQPGLERAHPAAHLLRGLCARHLRGDVG